MEKEIKNLDDFNDLLGRAEGGDADAQYDISLYYLDGLTIDDVAIIQPDAQLAFYWTKRAFENGNKDALVNYGYFLCAGEGCEKDIELGMNIYEQGVDAGDKGAANNLGREYRDMQNYERAFELYNLTDGKGDKTHDRVTVGMCYYHGVGVAQDKLKALELFKEVSEDNDDSGYEVNEANYMIGRMYVEGDVVERSFETARTYLELANEDEDHRSANELLMIIGRTKELR